MQGIIRDGKGKEAKNGREDIRLRKEVLEDEPVVQKVKVQGQGGGKDRRIEEILSCFK